MKHPVTNEGTTNLHCGETVIRPGETRMIDEHLVPPDRRHVAVVDKEELTDHVALQAAVSAKDIIEYLPDFSDDKLDEVAKLEAAGKNRSTVLEAIAAEKLRRAAASDEAKAAAEQEAADKEAAAAAADKEAADKEAAAAADKAAAAKKGK